ncbi:hypothetical protein E4U41_005075 [Claviceps citrina]|nr:hypothetical protein E4U41_005075 [Claviceps citrina]
MSLNGLDDPKVVEAYEGATSEPGGWLLLRYEGRDEIQVLSRGNGGMVEVRNAVAEYKETSPLYGFLKYRRRSVIIKYLPEDCSRIIQARVAVHLNAVCERFSPFDTIFEISTASELKDSKLSAACSLHTASCSTSSSTSSLRRRRLMEIAEEEEDDQRATKRQSIHNADDRRPQTAVDGPSSPEPVSLNSDLASSPEHSKFAAATTSDIPLFVGVNGRRTSVDSDTYTIGAYPYSKPKVKLGPRPSADANARPQTAGNFRPVSVIPAGLKMFGKPGKKGKGKDGSSLTSPPEEVASLHFSTSDDGQDRPTTSSSSVLDSASVSLPASAQKKPTISPEKARLMKAMQLREKQKLNERPSSSDEVLGDDTVHNADHDLTHVYDEAAATGSDSDCDRIHRRVSLGKDDSGVVLEHAPMSLAQADETSDVAPSDSHPASPLVGSSEADHSTQASSISGSTDETVQAKKEAEAEPKEDELDTPTKDVSQGLGIVVEPFVATDGDSVDNGNMARPSNHGGEGAGRLNANTDGSKRTSQVEPIKTTDLGQRKEGEDGTRSAPLEVPTPVSFFNKTPPLTPSFPPLSTKRGKDGASSPHALRTVSSPVRGRLAVPSSDAGQPSARSMSSGIAHLHPINQQQGGNLAKNPNGIGSSISQRIKALEKLSAATGGEVPPATPVRERPSSTFFAVKKREADQPPSVLDRASSFRNQSPPSPHESLGAPPEEGRCINHNNDNDNNTNTNNNNNHNNNRLGRSGSVTNRLSMFEYPTTSTGLRHLGVPSSGNNNNRGRPESVSVMARIVRDPSSGTGHSSLEPPRDPSEYNHVEFKQSPLVVDHQSAFLAAEKKDDGGVEHARDGGNEVYEQNILSRSRQSLSMVKGFIKERRKSATSDAGGNGACSPGGVESVHANAAVSPCLSVGSPRSSFSKDRDTVVSPTGSGFGDDAKSTNSDKKLSRAGRFMRRLSNFSGSRSKNSPPFLSATGTKEEAQEPVQLRPSTTGTPTIVSCMGDVNVQFPDSLLWKRRNMSLDSQGFLILSALPAQNGRPAQGTKRYHLSEFRPPYIPDVEVQELPNSVVLDLIEGSGIQVACEDRAGQWRVLQTLQEAHATRATTYGL